MIRIPFIAKNREIIIYEIENKVIKIYDRMWHSGIQIMPLQKANVAALENSRSKHLQTYAKLIREANSGTNLSEWEGCKTDEEVSAIVRAEAKLNGLIEVQKNEL